MSLPAKCCVTQHRHESHQLTAQKTAAVRVPGTRYNNQALSFVRHISTADISHRQPLLSRSC